MKKVLLASSALVAFGAVGAAVPAVAQDKLQLGLGGFAKQEFGYVKNDNYGGTPAQGVNRKGFDQQSDVEVYFRGTLKLDNGISVMVHVELEGETSADQIDEQYVRVFGSFGDLRLGSLNNAAYQMSYFAPEYGVGYNEAFIYGYITSPTYATNAPVFLQTARLSVDNDSNKIAYFTPRIFGFQGGVSYTPEHDDNGDTMRSGTRYRNGIGAAINYDNKFGALYVAGNVGYYRADAPINASGPGFKFSDIEGYNAGFNLGFANFLLGGAWQKYTSGAVSAANGGVGGSTTTANTSAKGTVWSLGGAYNFGPGGISLNWQKGKTAGSTLIPGDIENTALLLSARYYIGPGVRVYGTVARVEYEDENRVAPVDNKGWATIAGIGVEF